MYPALRTYRTEGNVHPDFKCIICKWNGPLPETIEKAVANPDGNHDEVVVPSCPDCGWLLA
jgi:hypothetical protein